MGFAAPATLDDALGLLSRHRDARIVAGGTDFFPALGTRPAPAHLIDITRIGGLGDIAAREGGWRIGAAVRWRDLVKADLPPCFDALKAAARTIGSVQIQNVGTLAGNLCNASPAADGVPPLLALDARVEIAGPGGARQIPVASFLRGVRQTALMPGEILSAVVIPAQPGGTGSAFAKLGSRRYLVISIVMVAANVWLRDGTIAGARVAVGAASPVARRLATLETALSGLPVDRVEGIAMADHLGDLAPIDDVRGSGAYRRDALDTLCHRAIRQAIIAADMAHG